MSLTLFINQKISRHFSRPSVSAMLGAMVMMGSISSISVAQMYPPDSDEGMPGEEMFKACGFCHAAQGQGRQRLDAPPIAGLQAWYVEKQLQNFDKGIRGYHDEDLPGAQMDIISAMFRNDATIKNVAAYVETLEPGAPPMLRGRGENAAPEPIERSFTWNSEYAFLNPPEPGRAAEGEKLYQTCVGCHGAEGLGNEAIGAPNLTVLAGWYMERQLEYFQDGIRGADERDTQGKLMAGIAKTLTTDQAIADVVAYIETL